MISYFTVFFLCLTFLLCNSQLKESFTLNISTSTGLPFYHWWNTGVGSGHGSLALRKDYQKQLKYAHDSLGIKYVRYHGILDDDVGSYNGVNSYSFINIDNIYDYFMSINMKPYVEISFMPYKLAINPSSTIMHYKGITSPPNSWNNWNEFIFSWMSHLVNRYGINEVSQWYFEVWNEPNCYFYVNANGCDCNTGNYSAYLELYNNTVHAIKAVSKEIKVGGPSTARLCWIYNFTSDVIEYNIPIDFLSTHEYPTDHFINQSNNQMEQFYNRLKNTFLQQQFNNPIEMVLSEFNSGLYSTNVHNHDNEYASSYMLYAIVYFQSLFKDTTWSFMSYWTFSDIFEEGGFNSIPFNNIFGMQTIRGIAKPVFRILELVHRFTDNIDTYYLAVSDNNNTSYNTSNNNQNIQIFSVLNNNKLVIFSVNWNTFNETIYNESISLTVNLNDYNNINISSINIYRIDKYNSNAFTKWLNIGMPEYPTDNQLNALNESSQIISNKFNDYKISNNVLTIEFNLDSYGCAVFEIDFENNL